MTARIIPLRGGPYRVAAQDGLGEFYCYPDGGGRGQVKRDYGGYGTTWAHGDNDVGILYFEGDPRPPSRAPPGGRGAPTRPSVARSAT